MGIFGKLFESLAGAAEPLPDNAVLIDVRSPEEFSAGHIEDAISLPLACLTRDIGSVVIDPATPIIVYCQSGGRSAVARRALLDIGYQNVINGGGIRSLAARMNRER
ncbi:MAG TPA: rhodanese-like domain-containing protein [Noviherbaspirillum sp.]|nr:rhodanese-like domain-containing protein [Noviherbaspirillum sp.]